MGPNRRKSVRNAYSGLPGITLVAGLFLCMQFWAITHLAEYGDHAHDHNGEPCLTQQLSDCSVAILEPPNLILAPPLQISFQIPAERQRKYRLDPSHPIRAPPPLPR